LYPISPFLLYINPLLLKYALDPLYENQETKGNYANADKYAMQNLGSWPIATGYTTEDGYGGEWLMPTSDCAGTDDFYYIYLRLARSFASFNFSLSLLCFP